MYIFLKCVSADGVNNGWGHMENVSTEKDSFANLSLTCLYVSRRPEGVTDTVTGSFEISWWELVTHPINHQVSILYSVTS